MADNDEIRKFIHEFTKFQGRMEHFEETENQWHKDTNVRLTNIELIITEIRAIRDSLIQMITEIKEVEQRQSGINIKQEGENVIVQGQQKVQDNRLGGLETKNIIYDLKLSTRDLGKIALLVTAITTPIVTLFIFLIQQFYPR